MRQTSLASWGLLGVLICISIVSLSLAEGVGDLKDTCRTRECIRKSNTVNRQLNRTMKPCKDYFGYVCGNWRGFREEVATGVKRKALKDLEHLLNHSRYKDEQSVAQTFVGAYKNCIREGKSTADIHALKHILRRFGITDWPVDDTIQKKISDVLVKSGLQPLFKYDVLKPKTHGGSGEIHLGAPTDFYVWPADYSDYSEYDGESISAAYETLIKEVIKMFKPNLTDEKIKKIAEKIIYVETTLQKMAYESTEETAEMKIGEFSKYTSIAEAQFPLLKILNRDFYEARVPLFENDTIFLKNKTYYKSVMEWLGDDSADTCEVANYIGWVRIRDLLDVTSTDLKKLNMNYDTATGLGNLSTWASGSKPEVCLRLLVESGLMYGGASKFYITKKFNDTDKKRVEMMAQDVKTSVRSLINSTEWMDETTKTQALLRISNMTFIMGFESYYLNETFLTSLYEFVGDTRPGNPFVRIYFNLTRNDNFQRIRTVRPEHPPVDLEEYGPLRSHALYNEMDHIFVYPAAALLTHYAGYGLPDFINYASLGANTARGMSNAFDKTDRINGKDIDFWTNETTKQYCKSQIRREFQDTFCDNSKDKNNYHAVAFADHLAVRAAFQAYRNASKEQDKLLPKLKEKDLEEQFFLFFASAYCPFSVYQESGAENATVYKDGLDMLLTNYTEFRRAYRCRQRTRALKY